MLTATLLSHGEVHTPYLTNHTLQTRSTDCEQTGRRPARVRPIPCAHQPHVRWPPPLPPPSHSLLHTSEMPDPTWYLSRAVTASNKSVLNPFLYSYYALRSRLCANMNHPLYICGNSWRKYKFYVLYHCHLLTMGKVRPQILARALSDAECCKFGPLTILEIAISINQTIAVHFGCRVKYVTNKQL